MNKPFLKPQYLSPQFHQSKYFTYFILFLMASNIIINYYSRADLFALGVNLIHQMQKLQHPIINIFFYAVTLLIDPVVVLSCTIALIILMKNKYKAFVIAVFMLLNTYLTGVLKAFYADPRPFWASQQIKSIGFYCPQEYGNPSGHSWFSVTLTFGVLIELLGVGKRFQYLYVSLAVIILVPMSRMYLGAHSLNQVLQGLFLGFSMIYLYHFSGLKLQIQSFLKNFDSQPKFKWKKLIVLLHIFYIFSFIINEQNINPYYVKIQQIWVTNIRNKCNKQVDTNHLNFMMLMINSLLVNLTTGIAFGYNKLVKSHKGRVYLSGKWVINEQKHSLILGHILYFAVQIGYFITGGVIAFITIYFLGKSHQVLFVAGTVASLVSGYLYTAKTFHTLFDKGIIRQVME